MDWLKNLLSRNPILALAVPSSLSGFDFVANLMVALSDGHIDANEFNHLMTSASGLETVALLLIMLSLRSVNKTDDKPKNKRKK